MRKKSIVRFAEPKLKSDFEKLNNSCFEDRQLYNFINRALDDLEINACKEKQLSNVRSRGHDVAIVLTPPHELTLEYVLEYIGPDELAEITPLSIRVRKRILNANDRKKIQRAEKEE